MLYFFLVPLQGWALRPLTIPLHPHRQSLYVVGMIGGTKVFVGNLGNLFPRPKIGAVS
jgi:hypothetical protein